MPITVFFDFPFLILDSHNTPPTFLPFTIISFGHFNDEATFILAKAFFTERPHNKGRYPIFLESIS